MRSTIFILYLLPILISAAGASASAIKPLQPTPFIRLSCRSTPYPEFCEDSLAILAPSIGHSPRRLAQAAISVTTFHARDASTFVYGLSQSYPEVRLCIRECFETLQEMVDYLMQSTKEMQRMGRRGSKRFNMHVYEVRTKLSTVSSLHTTCDECLNEDVTSARVKGVIRKSIAPVHKALGTALTLVTSLEGN